MSLVNLDTFKRIDLPLSVAKVPTSNEVQYEWKSLCKIPQMTNRCGVATQDDAYGRNLYIVGGMLYPVEWNLPAMMSPDQTTNNVYKYNIETNQIELFHALSYKVFGSAVGYYNQKLFIIGGMQGTYYNAMNTSSGIRYYYAWSSNRVIQKLDFSSSQTGIVESKVQDLSANIIRPAYCTVGNKLYIFGGCNFGDQGQTQAGYNINTFVSTNNDQWFDVSNKLCYVFDMDTETLQSISNLPFDNGGCNLSCCAIGDSIYIRNQSEFCRFDIGTSTYTTLTPFDGPNDALSYPEIATYNYNGTNVVLSLTGRSTVAYGEMYNPTTQLHTSWQSPAYPRTLGKLVTVNNVIYQTDGLCAAGYNSNSISAMENLPMGTIAPNPVVAKIPSGAYYHGLWNLDLTDGKKITVEEQLSDEDYYIRQGMYTTLKDYPLYIETKESTELLFNIKSYFINGYNIGSSVDGSISISPQSSKSGTEITISEININNIENWRAHIVFNRSFNQEKIWEEILVDYTNNQISKTFVMPDSDVICNIYVTVTSDSGGGIVTNDYNSLVNLPQINGVPLSGNKTSKQIGVQDAGDYAEESTSIYKLISKDGWIGESTPYTQEISAEGVKVDNNIIVGLDSTATTEQMDESSSAKVWVTNQSENSITVSALSRKPSIDIPIRIIIVG